MVTTPTATPDTIPVEEPTVAIDGLLLVHVPPGLGFVSVIVLNTHTLFPVDGPDIGPGEEITVIVNVLKQPVGSIYVMVAVPVEMPVTRPVAEPTVATAGLLLLHVPPGVADVSVVTAPIQTVDVPAIVAGSGLTVTTAVAIHPFMSV